MFIHLHPFAPLMMSVHSPRAMNPGPESAGHFRITAVWKSPTLREIRESHTALSPWGPKRHMVFPVFCWLTSAWSVPDRFLWQTFQQDLGDSAGKTQKKGI